MYEFLLLVALVFGLAGFVNPMAWIVAGLAVAGGLLVHGSEEVKESQHIESTGGRAAGCAISFALLALLAVLAFAGILGAGGKLP